MSNKRNLTLTVLILISLGVVLLVWFLLLPAVDRVKSSLAEKTDLRDKYTVQVENLNKAKKLLDNAGFSSGIPVTEDVLAIALPPRREYEDLLAMIENMAISSGINQAISISIGQVEDDSAAQSIGATPTPITISTLGDYSTIKDFIKTMQEGLRPVVIETVVMQPVATGGVSASLTATTYTRDTSVKKIISADENTEINMTTDELQTN